MFASWLDDALQRLLLSLAAMLPLLEALPHARLPCALVPVVACNAAEVHGPVHPGLTQFSMALLIIEDAGREP